MFALILISGCSSTPSVDSNPIDNPFGAAGAWRDSDSTNNITVRSKNGDRSTEVQLPNSYGSDLEVPMNTKYMNAPVMANESGKSSSVDSSYKTQKSTMGDREIVSTFGTTVKIEDEARKREIEQSLGVHESDELPNMDQSYLGKIDVVKQLFRNGRHEAALIEIDHMIKDYPTNAKLYEMRGTILDRMGYHDLALRSWKQSLEFKPNQIALKRMVDKREATRGVASEKAENKQ